MKWKPTLLLLIAIGLAVVLLRTPRPCSEPLTYRIGTIDERFGLSRVEFSSAVHKAASIWAKPLSRELFREDTEGKIEITLVYDHRQEAADKLKKLSYKMDYTKNTHDNMKPRFEYLKSQYEQNRAALDRDLDAFNTRINALNTEIEAWNRRGGAPENVLTRLLEERSASDAERGRLQSRQEETKRMVDEINSLALVMNEIAAAQNLDVVRYRDIGSRRGAEFQEGYFEQKKGRQTITLYHFYDARRLVRLLAHELGHALGLEHIAKPEALMYRLNQYDSLELSPDDIAALKNHCKAK